MAVSSSYFSGCMKDTEDAHSGLVSHIHNYEGKMWYYELSVFDGAPGLNSSHRIFLEYTHHRYEPVIGSNCDQSTCFFVQVEKNVLSVSQRASFPDYIRGHNFP